MTLREILQRYVQEVTPRKRSGYTEAVRVAKFLREQPVCELAVTDLTPGMFSAYRDKRLQLVKPGTVHRELGILRHALEVAQQDWDIALPANPLDRVRRPRLANARDRRLAPGEYEKLSRALLASRNRLISAVVEFAIHTAMRRGEILALCWEQVNWQQQTAYIAVTKTDVPRTIPLLDDALTVLKRIRPNQPAGRVFPMSMEALKQAWERARDRAGLHDLRFHDLRHEAISRFCEMGLTLPEVALISGHKDPRMLFRYMNLRPAELAARLKGRSWSAPSPLAYPPPL